MKTREMIFVSRGRGRGHAVPDVEIIQELRKAAPNLKVKIVSYGTGASVFAERGLEAIDLGLPDFAPVGVVRETFEAFFSLISAKEVVIHEEFAALEAARRAGGKPVFLTHWFYPPSVTQNECLSYADLIIFLGERGLFAEPTSIGCDVLYVGNLIRTLACDRASRSSLRARFGIPEDDFTIAVFPGSWGERQFPFARLVLDGFGRSEGTHKRLYWLGNHLRLMAIPKNVRAASIEKTRYPEVLMALSDVCVTRGTYNTSLELEMLGVPFVAIPTGTNPVDNIYVATISCCIAISQKECSSAVLARSLNVATRLPEPESRQTRKVVTSDRLASLILEHYGHIRSS